MSSAVLDAPKSRSWYQRIFAGNGLLWFLYFVLILASLITVSSAISSEYYKSISRGGLNPILKHSLMLVIGVASAIVMSMLSGKAYRYVLPRVSTAEGLDAYHAGALRGAVRARAEYQRC